MSGPGTGRYTTYVPKKSPRNERLSNLFNARPAASGQPTGDFYGSAYPEQDEAAKAAVARATANVDANGVGGLIPANGMQSGDPQMFPKGVDLGFGTHLDTDDPNATPNLEDVKWSKPGDPANAYVPDVSSPGAGKTEGVDKDEDPKLTVTDMAGETYIPGAPGTTTTSPTSTARTIGEAPIGKNLVMGKSSV